MYSSVLSNTFTLNLQNSFKFIPQTLIEHLVLEGTWDTEMIKVHSLLRLTGKMDSKTSGYSQ